MPSIFNHDSNACWPMRRSYDTSFCNSVTLSNVKEEMHINKVSYNKEDVTNTSPSNSNYHISSNGYYGYQPHVISNVSDYECSMDIQENVTNEIGIDQSIQDCQDFGATAKRKRNFQELLGTDSVKRFRQEESLDLTSASAPPLEPIAPTQSLQSYHRCTFEGGTRDGEFCESISRNLKKKSEDLTFFELMLKQTHGCDLYNFDSYDL